MSNEESTEETIPIIPYRSFTSVDLGMLLDENDQLETDEDILLAHENISVGDLNSLEYGIPHMTVCVNYGDGIVKKQIPLSRQCLTQGTFAVDWFKSWRNELYN